MGTFFLAAQLASAATPKPTPAPSPAARLTNASPAPSPTAKPKPKVSPTPAGPITTQVYSDDATFDSQKRIGVFTGHVRVFDPRFNIQSDKLTVFIHKEESQGLERAIAEGNVGVVRDKIDPNGGPPTKSVGLSDKAIYTSSDGNVELTGSPRVQEGLDTHISTSPDTVMVLNSEGHLTTHGPSRTEIKQEPSATPSPTPKPSPKPHHKHK